MNNTVHPTFTHAFMPHKFTDDAQAQAEVKKFAVARYGVLLDQLEALAAQAGGGFLTGAQFGPVDAYALTLTRWGGLAGHDPKAYKALWSLVQRVAQLPPVARAIERERLQLDLYKPA
jgi:glutathione S-transferase